METSSTAGPALAEAEDHGKGSENYPACRGAEEEEEEEPGDGPIVEEEGKDEEEGFVEEGGGVSSLMGEEEEEEEEEERRGKEPPCKVEDLLSEDIDESGPAPSAVAGETASSPASTVSGHDRDRDPDDLSDCLRAEMAAVSSDSDADDQWKGPGVAASDEGEGTVGGGVRGGVDTPPPEPPERPPPTDRQRQTVEPERLDFLGVRRQWRQLEEEVKGQMAAAVAAAGGRPLPQPGGFGRLAPVRSAERRPRPEAEPDGRGEEGLLLLAAFSPCSEDSGVEEPSGGRSPGEEPENTVEREIRLTAEREESFRRERSRTEPGGTTAPWSTAALPPRPHGEERRGGASPLRTPTFSISPSPSPSPLSSPRPIYHEMTAGSVIILEPDSACAPPSSSPRPRPHGPPLLCPAPPASRFGDWPPSDAPSVIILETSNLIIRSASEFCLSVAAATAGGGAGGGGEAAAPVQESTFQSNPFFKLRSRSSASLVEQEIRAVRQREEEWRRQRALLRAGGAWGGGGGGAARERYDTVLVAPSLLEGFGYERTEMPVRCVSSPSSPSNTRKMDRSTLSCDQRFPASLSSVSSSSSSSSAAPRRQNAMAQRWEAGLIANHSRD